MEIIGKSKYNKYILRIQTTLFLWRARNSKQNNIIGAVQRNLFACLGRDAVSLDIWCPTFRDNVLVSCSKVKIFKKNSQKLGDS
jgi:hypothetical protein